jgi:hypothetical protein
METIRDWSDQVRGIYFDPVQNTGACQNKKNKLLGQKLPLRKSAVQFFISF